MRCNPFSFLLALALPAAACSGSKDGADSAADGGDEGTDGEDGGDGGTDPFAVVSCADQAEPCVQIEAGDNEGLFETANLLEPGLTIVLGAGTWELDNQVTFRGADGISLIGQGMDETVLDFAAEEVQTNGIDAIGDSFLLEGLTVRDAKKDGVRVEDSDGVIFRAVRVTWSTPESSENGAYGLYPVKSSNVLIEDCEAHNAADAGIYVGQTRHTIVRNNLATGNVAGIEIENTQFADVYGNTATQNTGGLLIFDLPGNPIVGRDVWVHDNIVSDNNTPNFAPGGTVSLIPSGTGTVLLASRRVVIENNTYADNNTADIAVMSGLVIESDTSAWWLSNEELVGDHEDLGLVSDETGVFNYRTENIVVGNNDHSGSGTDPDDGDPFARELGFILGAVYGEERLDDVLYDAIEESAFDATDPAGNSNDNRICVGDHTVGTFASLDLEVLADRFLDGESISTADLFRPDAPRTPFDCTALDGGDIPTISLD
jgi:parallel beta-helix repeat protein